MMAQSDTIATGILESIDGERIVLRVPHTDYRLHLHLAVPTDAIADRLGKRIRGVIEAKAMKLNAASGGGRFIEPVAGEPRIIAGAVRAVDEAEHRVLVDAATPLSLQVQPGQDLSGLVEGGLVNCYVHSGTRFTPIENV